MAWPWIGGIGIESRAYLIQELVVLAFTRIVFSQSCRELPGVFAIEFGAPGNGVCACAYGSQVRRDPVSTYLSISIGRH